MGKSINSAFFSTISVDFLVSVEYRNLPLDAAAVVNSFDCFTKKYDDWQVAIYQSRNAKPDESE